MAYVYAKVNKETMNFIREQRKISYDYIERITHFSRKKVEMWEKEDNDKWPTINQAKQLAKCYHVPFAGFYMYPKDINVKHIPVIKNKRTIIDPIDDETAINLAILDLLYARDFYLETKNAFNEKIPSFNLELIGNDVSKWSLTIREYLEFDIEEQKKTTSSRKLYLYLREKVESKGIYVNCFKGVEPEIMRGVAIFDDSIPIIGINDKDRYPAKTFTLLHELVHIIKRSSSVCNEINNANTDDAEEVFCNAVAGETLIPINNLLIDSIGLNDETVDIALLDKFAKKYSVSSEVVARRFLDVGVCSKAWYLKISNDLKNKFIREKEEEKLKRQESGIVGIPRNMTREAIDRTSTDMCRLLAKGFAEGYFDKSDIAGCVGIKEKHINKFLMEVSKW